MKLKPNNCVLSFFCHEDNSKCVYFVKDDRSECNLCKSKRGADHCHACDYFYKKCKYQDRGICNSAVARVNKMTLEMNRLGIGVI